VQQSPDTADACLEHAGEGVGFGVHRGAWWSPGASSREAQGLGATAVPPAGGGRRCERCQRDGAKGDDGQREVGPRASAAGGRAPVHERPLRRGSPARRLTYGRHYRSTEGTGGRRYYGLISSFSRGFFQNGRPYVPRSHPNLISRD
jgi:hypothetical protein